MSNNETKVSYSVFNWIC